MSTAILRQSTKTPHPVEESQETKFQYPGIPTTCDGAEAVVHVEINVAQAAGAYPITSSTTMGGGLRRARRISPRVIPQIYAGRAPYAPAVSLR